MDVGAFLYGWHQGRLLYAIDADCQRAALNLSEAKLTVTTRGFRVLPAAPSADHGRTRRRCAGAAAAGGVARRGAARSAGADDAGAEGRGEAALPARHARLRSPEIHGGDRRVPEGVRDQRRSADALQHRAGLPPGRSARPRPCATTGASSSGCPTPRNRDDVERKIADQEKLAEQRKKAEPAAPPPPTDQAAADRRGEAAASRRPSRRRHPRRRRRRRPRRRTRARSSAGRLVGAGVIADGVAGYEGYRAKQKGDQLTKDSMMNGTKTFDPALETAGKNANIAAIALGIGGTAVAITGIIVLITGDSSSSEQTEKPATPVARLTLTPWISRGPVRRRRETAVLGVMRPAPRSTSRSGLRLAWPLALAILAGAGAARLLQAQHQGRRAQVQPGRGRREILPGRLQVRHVDADVLAESRRRRRSAARTWSTGPSTCRWT